MIVHLEVEIPGASRPDEIVVVGAHYDTVEGTAGADDTRERIRRRARTGPGDFVGLVGNLGSGSLVRHALGVFREHGGAIMITDTAPFRNLFYHTSGDTIDKLDFDRMTRVVDGIAAVVRVLASQA